MNTLLCCRGSGKVDSSKAKQRVARYRAVLSGVARLVAIFYVRINLKLGLNMIKFDSKLLTCYTKKSRSIFFVNIDGE